MKPLLALLSCFLLAASYLHGQLVSFAAHASIYIEDYAVLHVEDDAGGTTVAVTADNCVIPATEDGPQGEPLLTPEGERVWEESGHDSLALRFEHIRWEDRIHNVHENGDVIVRPKIGFELEHVEVFGVPEYQLYFSPHVRGYDGEVWEWQYTQGNHYGLRYDGIIHGMGWVWMPEFPWLYSLGMDGQWMWISGGEEANPAGFYAYVADPEAPYWIFGNCRWGWYYRFGTEAGWQQFSGVSSN